MPGKMHTVPETMALGAVDQSVVLLVVGDDSDALTQWMRQLLVYRLAISGKVIVSTDGHPVAVLRAHPSRLPEIAERRAECVHDLITLPRDLLANL